MSKPRRLRLVGIYTNLKDNGANGFKTNQSQIHLLDRSLDSAKVKAVTKNLIDKKS